MRLSVALQRAAAFARPFVAAGFFALAAAASPAAWAGDDAAALRDEVLATERAFAATMARRDLAAFASFLAEEAIFFSGTTAQRGKAEIVAAWSAFYEGADAPFSWAPDAVEALDSGTLALSSGPVYDPAGNLVGRFNSIWRREAPGTWRIVFDKGESVCRSADAGD
jgi:ketosteroid isomerase-like protein